MRQIENGKLSREKRMHDWKHGLKENCDEIRQAGRCTESTNYLILIGQDIKVTFCDMSEKRGAWTMIHQHGFPRTDQWGCYKKGCNSLHKEDWNKTMSDYITGFGKPSNKEEYPSDFWIGLNAMNVLTNKNMEARIELIDWDQKRRFANYGKFKIGGPSEGYKLTIRGFDETLKGNVGNAFGGIQEDKFCKTEKCLDEQLNLKTLTKQNGMQFSTPDIDNDYYCRPRSFGANGKIKFEDDEKEFCESMDELSCAAKDGTGFWYNSCSAVNLNGRIFKSNDDNLKNKDGMIWSTWHKENYSLIYSSIFIRPAK